MDSPVRIAVDFTPELKDALGATPDLREILDDAGIDAMTEWSGLPPTHPEERTKALAETILLYAASAAAAAATIKLLESTLTHYLDHKAVRDSRFEYWVNEPMLDGKGKPMRDDDGQPRMIRRRVSGFDKLPALPAGGFTLSVGLTGVKMSTDTSGAGEQSTKAKK